MEFHTGIRAASAVPREKPADVTRRQNADALATQEWDAHDSTLTSRRPGIEPHTINAILRRLIHEDELLRVLVPALHFRQEILDLARDSLTSPTLQYFPGTAKIELEQPQQS